MRVKVGLLGIWTGGREAEVQLPGNFEGPGAGRECRWWWGGMPSSGSSSRMAAQAWAPRSLSPTVTTAANGGAGAAPGAGPPSPRQQEATGWGDRKSCLLTLSFPEQESKLQDMLSA